MKTVSDCYQITEDNVGPLEPALKEFYRKYREASEYYTWVDPLDNNTLFSLACVKAFGALDDAVFKLPREYFLSSKFGIPLFHEIAKTNKHIKSMEVASNEELILSLKRGDKLLDAFSRVEDKKILIIMGGPSTNDIKWDPNQYDEIWLLNEGYKSEIAKTNKISLITLAPDQNHWDPALHQFLTKNPEAVILFCADRLDPPTALFDMNKIFDMYPGRTLAFNTRYSSCIGIGPKIILYAVLTGAKQVDFVGLDGRNKQETDGNLSHAFNKNKQVPDWFKTENGLRVQKRQGIMLYEYLEYIKKTFKFDFKVRNLSQDHPMNQYGDISRAFENEA